MSSDQIINMLSQWGEKIFLAGLIFLVGYMISSFIGNFIYRLIITSQGGDEYGKRNGKIVKRIIIMVIMTFIFLTSVSILGINVTLIMGGLTFAIGYAMQEILGNMFGSVMLVTNPRFAIGDLVQVLGDVKVFGTIEAINVRNSIIRSFDSRTTIIPNMKMMKTPFKTFKREEIVRYTLNINISRDAEIEKAKKIITTAVNKHEYTIQKDYTDVIVKTFSEQGITLDIHMFFNPQCGYSSFKTRSEVRQQIFTDLKANGFTIPYPRRLLDDSKLNKIAPKNNRCYSSCIN